MFRAFSFLVASHPVATWPSIAVLSFDGQDDSFPGFVMGADLRRRAAKLDVVQCAFALVLQTGSTARNVCLATGSYELVEPDASGRALEVSRDNFAPRSLDAAGQSVANFSRRKACPWASIWPSWPPAA